MSELENKMVEQAEPALTEPVLEPEVPAKEEFFGFDEPPVKPIEPVKPEPVQEPVKETDQDLAEENRLLRLQMLKLDPYAFGEPEAEKPEVPGETPPVKPVQPGTEQIPEYLTDEEYDNIFSDKASLNRLLHKVAKGVREETLREIYPVVTQVQERYREAEKAISAFYKDNPDLQPYQEHIDVIASGIVAKRPGLSPRQILEAAGKQVRPLVRANKTAPGFTKPGSVAQPQTPPKLTEFEKEAKDLYGQ